jgi:aminoglycoside/choline kinase family phosphotransferase
MEQRAQMRKEFVMRAGWAKAEVHPLIPDASFRRYFRLVDTDRSVMLMDAPPEHESIKPFLSITHHLQRIGLRTPEIYCHDTDTGFILLEDLGEKTFTVLLKAGANESELYQRAIQILVELQSSALACDINTGNYDFVRFMDEACLFTQWYLPGVTGRLPAKLCEDGYIAAWKSIYDELPEIQPTLVLRDYHVDNLMMVDDQCAVLDYQDALIGSPAYDVVSLLEDARRDIDGSLATEVLAAYFNALPDLDRKAFEQHYQVWGAQRHCKVAGIFMRLWLRDNKPHYLGHLARVMGLLRKNLEYPALRTLSDWFADNGITLSYRVPAGSREQILSVLQN